MATRRVCWVAFYSFTGDKEERNVCAKRTARSAVVRRHMASSDPKFFEWMGGARPRIARHARSLAEAETHLAEHPAHATETLRRSVARGTARMMAQVPASSKCGRGYVQNEQYEEALPRSELLASDPTSRRLPSARARVLGATHSRRPPRHGRIASARARLRGAEYLGTQCRADRE